MCTVCKLISILNVWMLCYTGSVQEFNVPILNKQYVIECWGASGAKSTGWDHGKIGLGGYVYCQGNVSVSKLYICIGGKGSGNANSSTAYNPSSGGYNGGGNGQAGGGGATHVATTKVSNGILSDYVNNKDAVLAVAGGAGGCDNHIQGGAGGGLEGGSTSSATGGSQTAGGTSRLYGNTETSGFFGRGANCNTSGDSGAGGGGGWYGGGASGGSNDGAGGSGHIHSSWTGYFQSGIREGNGKCTISWHPNI